MPKVEQVGPGDVARVRALRLRSLADAPDAFWVSLEDEQATPEDVWRERLGDPDGPFFVVVEDGVDVGLARGSRHWRHDGDAILTHVWVAPEARGCGAGQALVEAVTSWARDGGFRQLRLEVADDNAPAVRLYARMGFTPSGETGTLPAPRDHITEHERVLPLHT
jgi:GNAT superfamily N-acetyltransferase